MNNYDFWKMAWEEKWATEEDIKQAVGIGQLTDVEYEQIVGVAYSA